MVVMQRRYKWVGTRARWEALFADKADRITTYEGEGLYDTETGVIMETQRTEVCMPMTIIHDVAPHMFRGRYIGTREDQRELRRRDGWVPFETVGEAATMPKRDFDTRDDHWQDWLHSTKQKVTKRAGLDEATVSIEKAAKKEFGSIKERVKPKPISVKAEV